MPAMTDLLVKDDDATPTEFTLVPISDNPFPQWRGNVAGVPLEGQPRFSVKEERLKNGGFKVTSKLELPVMETLGASGTSSGYVAPPKVAYATVSIFTMFIDKRSTSDDRANTLKMHVGLLQGASSTTATGTLDQASLGDAWKDSTLPVVYSYTGMIYPN